MRIARLIALAAGIGLAAVHAQAQQHDPAMHRNASRFAVAAKDAGATGDVKPALSALAATTAQCVACHAGYRVK